MLTEGILSWQSVGWKHKLLKDPIHTTLRKLFQLCPGVWASHVNITDGKSVQRSGVMSGLDGNLPSSLAKHPVIISFHVFYSCICMHRQEVFSTVKFGIGGPTPPRRNLGWPMIHFSVTVIYYNMQQNILLHGVIIPFIKFQPISYVSFSYLFLFDSIVVNVFLY